ncbi:anti-sigma factor [Demequina sp. NBRC 110055]|uniref:anti-sigma factor n=1 Tax=Demequina sp. NBRC 110055 TaxID=1570344 RepID=UPI0009FC0772|nr:anti-sigma factor [Demequina sp. NBRC 110055]
MTENLHTLAAPYAVGALDPAELSAFEDHLATCADCQEEVASLSLATEALADSHAAAPPPSLHARVMDEVARTAQLPPVLDPAGTSATTSKGPTPAGPSEPASGDADVLTFSPAARRRRWWIAAPVAAAAAAVLVVGGVMIADVRADRAAELAMEKDVMSVAASEDMEAVSLGLGSGKVMVSSEMNSVALMGTEAAMPDDGKEYQLWLVMADGTIQAGPTFTPREDGVYMSVSEVDVAHMAAVALTEEPEGGSDAPTMEPFAVTEMPTEA